MREFCTVVRKHLQQVFIQTPDESQFGVLAKRFEQLHSISYVIGAINGLHILVLALVVGGEYYYCLKLFHSVILQRFIRPDCMFDMIYV